MGAKRKLIQSTVKLTKAQFNRVLENAMKREAQAAKKVSRGSRGGPSSQYEGGFVDPLMPEAQPVGLGEAMQRGMGGPQAPPRIEMPTQGGPGPLTVKGMQPKMPGPSPMDSLLDIRDKNAAVTHDFGLDLPKGPGFYDLLDARLNSMLTPVKKASGPPKSKLSFAEEPVKGRKGELSQLWKESPRKLERTKEIGTGLTPSKRVKFDYKAYMTGSQKDAAQRSKSPRRRKGPNITKERILSGQATPGELMSGVEPLEEEVYSRLYLPGREGAGKKPLDLPHEMAKKLHATGGFEYEAGSLPKAKVFTKRGKTLIYEPASRRAGSEMGRHIPGKFVKRRYKPVVSPKVDAEKVKLRHQKKMVKEAREAENLDLIKKNKFGRKMKELPRSVNRTLSGTPIEIAQKQDAMAESVWKYMGQGRSTYGRLWDRWRLSAPGRKQKSAKEYFETNFIRWFNNPEGFKQVKRGANKEREANFLEMIWKEYDKATGGS